MPLLRGRFLFAALYPDTTCLQHIAGSAMTMCCHRNYAYFYHMQKVHLSLTAIQHVGIPVTNLPASEVFYNNLGFENVMQANFTHDGETGTCIMMQQGTIVMELYQLPQKELNATAARKDGHIDHIAFDVPDADTAFAALKAAGYRIIEAAPVYLSFWKKGCKYFNVLGPDGERLEFNEIII